MSFAARVAERSADVLTDVLLSVNVIVPVRAEGSGDFAIVIVSPLLGVIEDRSFFAVAQEVPAPVLSALE
jgi:hypothetical protein